MSSNATPTDAGKRNGSSKLAQVVAPVLDDNDPPSLLHAAMTQLHKRMDDKATGGPTSPKATTETRQAVVPKLPPLVTPVFDDEPPSILRAAMVRMHKKMNGESAGAGDPGAYKLGDDHPRLEVELSRWRFLGFVSAATTITLVFTVVFYVGVPVRKHVVDEIGQSEHADSVVDNYNTASGYTMALVSMFVGILYDSFQSSFWVFLHNVRWFPCDNPAAGVGTVKRIALVLIPVLFTIGIENSMSALQASQSTIGFEHILSAVDLTYQDPLIFIKKNTTKTNATAVEDTILKNVLRQRTDPFVFNKSSVCVKSQESAQQDPSLQLSAQDLPATSVIYGFSGNDWNREAIPKSLIPNSSVTIQYGKFKTNPKNFSTGNFELLTALEIFLQGKMLLERSISDSTKDEYYCTLSDGRSDLDHGALPPGTGASSGDGTSGVRRMLASTSGSDAGGNTGSANTGGGNTGSANTGGGSTGSANTGTGSANTGGGNTGSANAGGGNTGSVNTGGGSTGSANTGGGSTGSANTGGGSTGSANTGGGSTSSANTGGGSTGSANTGGGSTGSANTGNSNTGNGGTSNVDGGDASTGASNNGDTSPGDTGGSTVDFAPSLGAESGVAATDFVDAFGNDVSVNTVEDFGDDPGYVGDGGIDGGGLQNAGLDEWFIDDQGMRKCVGAVSSLLDLKDYKSPTNQNLEYLVENIAKGMEKSVPAFARDELEIKLEKYHINEQLLLELVQIDVVLDASVQYDESPPQCAAKDTTWNNAKRELLCNNPQLYLYLHKNTFCGADKCVFLDFSKSIDFRKQVTLMPFMTNCSTSNLRYSADFQTYFPSGCKAQNNSVFLYGLGSYVTAKEFGSDYYSTGFPYLLEPRRHLRLAFGKLSWELKDLASQFGAECSVGSKKTNATNSTTKATVSTPIPTPTPTPTPTPGTNATAANATPKCLGLAHKLDTSGRWLLAGSNALPLTKIMRSDFRQPIPLVTLNERSVYLKSVSDSINFERLNAKFITTSKWNKAKHQTLKAENCSMLMDSFMKQIENNNFFLEDPVQIMYTSALFYLYQDAGITAISDTKLISRANQLTTDSLEDPNALYNNRLLGDEQIREIRVMIPATSAIPTYVGCGIIGFFIVLAAFARVPAARFMPGLNSAQRFMEILSGGYADEVYKKSFVYAGEGAMDNAIGDMSEFTPKSITLVHNEDKNQVIRI